MIDTVSDYVFLRSVVWFKMMIRERGDVLRVGDWLVNPALDTLSRGAEVVKLEPRTTRLLMCLADSVGTVVSVDRLLGEVWNGVVVGPASVYQAVSQLRKLLGDVDAEPTYIATVPRKGYRLVATVHRVAAEAVVPTTMSVVPAAPAALQATNRWPSRLPGWLALLAILLVGCWIWAQVPNRAGVGESSVSIGVLPFIDLTTENTEQSFCDGLTEELSNRLAQDPRLRVVARTSAFEFRGRGEDVRRIGKALDADQILEGSVRTFGDRVRVTVQLIDTHDGYHLWSGNFDRSAGDVIQLQEDISRSVAETLQSRSGIAVKEKPLARPANLRVSDLEYGLGWSS